MAFEYVCVDCGRTFARRGGHFFGPDPEVCKGCRNERCLARLGPAGRERKRPRAKASRLRKRIVSAEAGLQSVEARPGAL